MFIDYSAAKYIQKEKLERAQLQLRIKHIRPSFRESLANRLLRWARRLEPVYKAHQERDNYAGVTPQSR